MKHIFIIPNHTRTYYNPKTNQLKTGGTGFGNDVDFENIGHKKVAEAFTSVNDEERKVLWKALTNGKTYSFDFSFFNSKLRHKLNKLGIYQFPDKPLKKGVELLQKISNKNQ